MLKRRKRRAPWPWALRQVLDCGSPLPLLAAENQSRIIPKKWIGTDKRVARALRHPFHYDSAALKKPGGIEQKLIAMKKNFQYFFSNCSAKIPQRSYVILLKT